MTDRMPDFEDIEFDDLEAVGTGTAEPVAPTPTPAPVAASAKAETATKAAAGAPKGMMLALLGVSGLSLLTTIGFAAALLTKADPVAALDAETKETIVRIEAQLAGQQKKLDTLALALPSPQPAIAAAPGPSVPAAAPAPAGVSPAELDALAAAMHANQKMLESLPQAVAAQLDARLARIEAVARTRPSAAPRRAVPRPVRQVRQVREAPARPLRVEVAAKAAPAQDDEIRYP